MAAAAPTGGPPQSEAPALAADEFALAVSCFLYEVPWTKSITYKLDDSVAKVRQKVMDALYADMIANGTFDSLPYHGLWSLLLRDAEDPCFDLETMSEANPTNEPVLLTDIADPSTFVEELCVASACSMTEFFVYPINAIVLGAASEWIHGEDSVITFPLRMFRQEGLPYFYYGLHWHVAVSYVTWFITFCGRSYLIYIPGARTQTATWLISAVLYCTNAFLQGLHHTPRERRACAPYTFIDAILYRPTWSLLKQRSASVVFWSSIGMTAIHAASFSSEVIGHASSVFNGVFFRFVAARDQVDLQEAAKSALDPKGLCLSSIFAYWLSLLAQEKANTFIGGYMRHLATRHMNALVARYGRYDAQKYMWYSVAGLAASLASVSAVMAYVLPSSRKSLP